MLARCLVCFFYRHLSLCLAEGSGLPNGYCVKAKETRDGQVQLGTPCEPRLQKSWAHGKLGGLSPTSCLLRCQRQNTADSRKLVFGVRLRNGLKVKRVEGEGCSLKDAG